MCIRTAEDLLAAVMVNVILVLYKLEAYSELCHSSKAGIALSIQLKSISCTTQLIETCRLLHF